MRFFILILFGVNLYYSVLCFKLEINYMPITSEQNFQENYNFLKEMASLLPPITSNSDKKSITTNQSKKFITNGTYKKCACQMKKNNLANLETGDDYFAPLNLEEEITKNDTSTEPAYYSQASIHKNCDCNRKKINFTQLQEQSNNIEQTLTRVEIHRKKRLRQNLAVSLKHYNKQ